MAHQAGAYPGFPSMKRLGVFLLPPGRDASPSQGLPGGYPFRGTVRVKCLAQEHNTMSPARARNRTARSGDERTDHEATAPPMLVCKHGLIDKTKQNQGPTCHDAQTNFVVELLSINL